MSNEKPLSNEGKEQFAFRVEALTFLCTACDLLDEINKRLAEIHEELSEKEQSVENDFDGYADSNRKFFVKYLSRVLGVTDEGAALFKELKTLRDKA